MVTFLAAGATVRVNAEVARDAKARARGLMFRKQLGASAGMLFVFQNSAVQHFYMKNTYIPLDMIFVTDDLKVVGVVHSAAPLTTTTRSVERPSRYVVEVNGGFARAHGIVTGTPVRISGL